MPESGRKIGLVLINYHSEQTIWDYLIHNSILKICDEIVIVNNGTKDENILNKIIRMSEKIHVIKTGANLGYAKANNIGMKYLANKQIGYILISNNDVTIERRSIDKCVEALKANPELGAAAPRMRTINGELTPLRYIELGYMRLFLRVLIPETVIDRRTQSKLHMHNNAVCQSFLPGSFFVISTKAAIACDFFDSGTFLFGEEEILNKRLRNNGYFQAALLDCEYTHLHAYKLEKASKRYHDCKILMESERLYFKKYLSANFIQMAWVYILQWLYIGVRYLSWRKDEWQHA